MARLDYHGHSSFTLTTDDGTRVVIDPFFNDNPWTQIQASDVEADFIFCTHGHYDHFADALEIAGSTEATLVGTFELVSYAEIRGIEKVHPMHIGGGWDFPFGRVKMTAAQHGGMIAGEGAEGFTTNPAGLLFDLGPGKRLYDAGDTGLTLDMQLLKGKVDVALLPIGDNFTMGPEDAVTAIEFIEPSVVIPIHYNTWPVIDQNAEDFRTLVGDRATVEIVEPGRGVYEF